MAVWMDHKVIMLSERSQREKTNTVWYHSYMEMWKIEKNIEKENRLFVLRSREFRLGKMKGCQKTQTSRYERLLASGFFYHLTTRKTPVHNTCKLNLHVVHLKLIQWCVNYFSMKVEK